MKIKTDIANNSHRLKEVSGEIAERLESKGAGGQLVFDVRVAVEEALRNAMLHGNRMDPGKKVNIEAEFGEKAVRITVIDEGSGFDHQEIPDPTDEENILKTGGRGVFLIKHLMDEVKYEDGGRKVVMVKYFKAAERKNIKCDREDINADKS